MTFLNDIPTLRNGFTKLAYRGSLLTSFESDLKVLRDLAAEREDLQVRH